MQAAPHTPARGKEQRRLVILLPCESRNTLTTRANAVTNRHAWNPRMTRPARSISTVRLSGSQPDKGETAAGRVHDVDTGCAAADAAAAVPARAQPWTIPAKNCDTLADDWGLNHPECGVLLCQHPLHDRDAAAGFADGCTGAVTNQSFFGTLQRSSHGCGAASAMLRMAAPAAPAAKGATWMD